MERLHVSRSRLAQVDERNHYAQYTSDKPSGFWWGVGRAWLDWCESEDFRIGGHIHELDIDDAKILRISSVEELDRFTSTYDAPSIAAFPSIRGIRWHRVAQHYDGIEIAPYLWERRLSEHTRWYYGWDCASGVTWRPQSVVRAVRYVGEWVRHAGAERQGVGA